MLISQGTAFMTDTLVNNLIRSGSEVISADPSITAIGAEKEHTDIILLFAGDSILRNAEVLVYLKDLCSDRNIPLCIIGYEKEFASVHRFIPKGLITREFSRPFDVKNLTAELLSVVKDTEELKKGRHILLVDDDVTFLRLMQDWLSMKYRITAVKSGMQAITYIASHTPDLILLDYEMPITPGSQIMEMIRSEPNSAGIPIIFLTGKSDRESVMNVMRLKPEGYLLKSMHKEDIITAVDNFFATRKWKAAAADAPAGNAPLRNA